MSLRFLALLTAAAIGTAFGQTNPLAQLIEAARQSPPDPSLQDLIATTLSPKGGTAVWGQDYLFVTDAAAPASISIDNEAPGADAPGPGLEPVDAADQDAYGCDALVSVLLEWSAIRTPVGRHGIQPGFVSAARRAEGNAQ